MYLVVRCPFCGRPQLFQPKSENYKSWRKRCVYCNKSFSVNPKSKHSSSIILFVGNVIEEAREFLKKLLEER